MVSQKQNIAIYCLFFLIGCTAQQDAVQTEPLPNIVLILSDDQGCGDAGFTGNDRLRTPNLDQLAAEGMTFSNFQVAPVCAPTRAGLLTGRHHLRTGVRGVIEGREFMVGEEVTVAEMLQDAGYQTALFGKWHLGEHYPWLPHGQGFDEYIGFRQGSSDYFDIVLDNKGEPYPTSGYLTDVLTDLAIDFIDRKKDDPFFLYLPYNAPHGPLQVPDAYVEPYADLPDRTAKVYGMMASLDEQVGRLLRHLDSSGLSENTLIFYFSDNGPLYGNRNAPDERFNCGLRGQKYDVYQGGVQVPLLTKWQGRISAGQSSERLISHLDLLPTILDAAGLSVPDSIRIDGRSLLPLLESPESDWADRTLFMTYPGEQVKNKEDAPYPGGMAVTERFKMVDGAALYDIVNDPAESENIADEYPDVFHTLDSSYQAFWGEATSGRAPYPRPQVGHPEENPVRFLSHFADLEGDLRFQFGEDPPRFRTLGVHHDWVGKWDTVEGKVKWHLRFVEPGNYQFSLRLRCNPSDAGAEIQIAVGDSTLNGQLNQCGGSWVEQSVGSLFIPAGDQDVEVQALTMPGSAVMDLDQLIIEFKYI